MRINVGCGMTPTPGWINLDNSPSLTLARWPSAVRVLRRMGLISATQAAFAEFAQHADIRRADATKGLPLGDCTVDVLYSSHMLEHLDRTEARRFLKDALRVLKPGGVIRLAVPDLGKKIGEYLEHGDADKFLAGTLMCIDRPKTLVQRLRFVVAGPRHHQWMYDERSLTKLLTDCGFIEAARQPAGSTTIPDSGELDVAERAEESLYVEARRSSAAG